MSRERARRREEREREAAVRRAATAAQAERRERAARRRQRFSGRLPGGRSRPTGVLAERRRRQLRATLALLAALNLLAWLLLRDLPITALLLIVSVLVAPVVHTMLWRR